MHAEKIMSYRSLHAVLERLRLRKAPVQLKPAMREGADEGLEHTDRHVFDVLDISLIIAGVIAAEGADLRRTGVIRATPVGIHKGVYR